MRDGDAPLAKQTNARGITVVVGRVTAARTWGVHEALRMFNVLLAQYPGTEDKDCISPLIMATWAASRRCCSTRGSFFLLGQRATSGSDARRQQAGRASTVKRVWHFSTTTTWRSCRGRGSTILMRAVGADRAAPGRASAVQEPRRQGRHGPLHLAAMFGHIMVF
jgi:hypothetical protein